MASNVRIELLDKENYDTWKIQMEALLIKNDLLGYVDGTIVKPEIADADWKKSDKKAKSDIILSISPSEIKNTKGCGTSKELWTKLEGFYQSKGPARKATLLKQLILVKIAEGDDVREHLGRFFDAVDKLADMEVAINDDLLAILLLYTLPTSYENFRCAIESRDKLPKPEELRIKIIEETDSKRSNGDQSNSKAFIAKTPSKKHFQKNKGRKEADSTGTSKEPGYFPWKCG